MNSQASDYFTVGEKGRPPAGARFYPVKSKHRTWALCGDQHTAHIVAALLNGWKEAE